jgi:hypothetical protein
MTLKTDAMMDFIAEKLGIPQKIRNTQEERMMMTQQMAETAQQVVQQNPEIGTGGETDKKILDILNKNQ